MARRFKAAPTATRARSDFAGNLTVWTYDDQDSTAGQAFGRQVSETAFSKSQVESLIGVTGGGDWRDELGDDDGIHDIDDLPGRSDTILADLSAVFAEADAQNGDLNGDNIYAWGWRTFNTFDDLGRLESTLHRQDPGWTTGAQNDDVYQTGEHARTTTRTYANDSDGRIDTLSVPEGDLTYEYDDVTGRHERTTASHNGVTSTDTIYSYDELSRLTQVAATFFNATGSVTSTTNYDYLVSGQLLEETTNGNTTTRKYDVLGRLLAQETVNATGQLAAFDYYLDKAGHRLRIDETIDPDPATSNDEFTRQADYEYDALYRLTKETVTDTLAGVASSFEQSYYFDLVGNRVRKVVATIGTDPLPANFTAGTTASTYNDRDQLLTATSPTATQKFGYDANGSLTSEHDGSAVLQKTQAYDLANRLVEADVDGDAVADLRLAYDHQEGRVARHELDAQGQVTASEHYLLDRSNPTGYEQVLEQASALNAMPELAFALAMDVVAQVDPIAAATFTVLYDGHGSTRGIVDATGQLASGQIKAYDAFGVATTAQTTILTPLGYAGEWFDNLLQELYLRSRFYDSATGRLGAFDSYEGGSRATLDLHKYVFGRNDGVNRIDPLGTFSYTDTLAAIGIRGIVTNLYLATFEAVYQTVTGVYGGLNADQILGQFILSQFGLDLFFTIAAGINYVIDWGDDEGNNGDPALPANTFASRLAPAGTQLFGKAARKLVPRVQELTGLLYRAGVDAQSRLGRLDGETGRHYGTRVHTAWGGTVRGLSDRGLGDGMAFRVEKSFDLPKGYSKSKNGVRLDSVLYDAEGKIIAVYDLKTGNASLSRSRVREIRAALGEANIDPGNPIVDAAHVPIIGLLI